jgi:hypothetical protein
MVDTLITISRAEITRQINDAIAGLDVAEDELDRAIYQATIEYMEQFKADAVERAPIGVGGGGETTSHSPGGLRASAVVDGPHEVADGWEAFVGFNKEYAAMRDLGGTIKPRIAKALFIPLRRGAVPGDPDLVLGEDFILVPGPTTRKQFVTQEGTAYLSGLMPEKADAAPSEIGRRVIDLFKAGDAA